MKNSQAVAQGPRADMKIKAEVLTKKGNYFEVMLPAKRIVCPRCDGTGTHVNPNIDGHGISPDEFNQDPDFKEAYFRGDYDVTCEECHGRNVVEVVDWEALTPKMQERLQRYEDAESQAYWESYYERRAEGRSA